MEGADCHFCIEVAFITGVEYLEDGGVSMADQEELSAKVSPIMGMLEETLNQQYPKNIGIIVEDFSLVTPRWDAETGEQIWRCELTAILRLAQDPDYNFSQVKSNVHNLVSSWFIDLTQQGEIVKVIEIEIAARGSATSAAIDTLDAVRAEPSSGPTGNKEARRIAAIVRRWPLEHQRASAKPSPEGEPSEVEIPDYPFRDRRSPRGY